MVPLFFESLYIMLQSPYCLILVPIFFFFFFWFRYRLMVWVLFGCDIVGFFLNILILLYKTLLEFYLFDLLINDINSMFVFIMDFFIIKKLHNLEYSSSLILILVLSYFSCAIFSLVLFDYYS